MSGTRSSRARREAARRAPSSQGRLRVAGTSSQTPSLDWGALTQVFTIPGMAIFPLRLFLGFTFLYAGIQKLTDPGFFRIGSSTYIGSQLLAYSRGSPIRFLLSHFLEHAQFFGALTILTEMGIGALVLLGLFTRLAALGGLGLNLIFFLSASWHTYPYFMGSDIVFVMAWLTLAIAGPGGLALDAVIRERLQSSALAAWQRLLAVPLRPSAARESSDASGDPTEPESGRGTSVVISRGEVLMAGAATVVLLILGLVPRGRLSALPASSAGKGTAPANPTHAGSSAPAGAKKVGTMSQLPVNSAIGATDPKSGDPAIIVRPSGSHVYAYDAICTHAGCTVEYDPQYKLIVCPCHGGAYDPAHAAQVVAGPPPVPLTELPITIDSAGNIYLS